MGILAMHGLVSSDHTGHQGSTPSPMSMSASTGASAPKAARTHHGDADLAGLTQPAGLDLRDVVVGAVGLCLAVLLVGLLLHRAGRGWTRIQPSRPATTVPPVGTSPPGRGPPRLLLAQLCVLRT
jgi:hypothetical protein